jgi:hypothetical protein
MEYFDEDTQTWKPTDRTDLNCLYRIVPSDQKEADAEENTPNAREIIGKVLEYYYGDDKLERALRNFAYKHAALFESLDSESDEFQTVHMQLWTKFRQLFEKQLENFICQSCSLSVDAFFSLVQADLSIADDDGDSGAAFAATMNAAFRFENFVAMMKTAHSGEFAWHWI